MTNLLETPTRESLRDAARALGIFALGVGSSIGFAPGARAQEPEAAPRLAPPGASGGELIPEQACFDVDRYTLRLRVDPAQETIAGVLQMAAHVTAPTSKIALDLDMPLRVEAIESRGQALAHQRVEGRVFIDLDREVEVGAELDITVRYGGAPRVSPNPPWKGGFTWSKTPDGQPWIATSCQGEGADLWWPCKDHPSDKPMGMVLKITIPDGLFCASNGVLDRDQPTEPGWHEQTWRLDLPFSNYGIALNIGPYVELRADYTCVDGTEMPVYFWCLTQNKEKAEALLPEFLSHLRFYEELLGPYPFRASKYGVVETPHLGMEHQTIIAYGNKFRRSPQRYDWLHHHELSHEWWGNLVTCRDWKDMWIHEGFGTYMQALYLEKTLGTEAYFSQMKSQQNFGNRRPVAPRLSRNSKQIYFGDDGGPSDNDIYYKGAWVLHTLRYVLGDEIFFATLREFCYPDKEKRLAQDGSCVRLVDTEEYIALVEKRSGQDLKWFFEVYLRQPALPELIVEREPAELRLRWKTPEDLAFPMPVPVEIAGMLQRVEVPATGAKLAVPLDAAVRIDPHHWILRAR